VVTSGQGHDRPGPGHRGGPAADPQIAADTVLDGELVTWNGTRLDFDLLQRRLVNRAGRRPVWRRGTLRRS
jgi:hypothetical protein